MESVTTNPYHYGQYYTQEHLPEEIRYRAKKVPFATSYGRTKVGNDVWIGTMTTIKAGIEIGDGAVIAGASNVVRDIPAYSIVGGNPARVLRRRFPDEICDRLIESQWWTISPQQLRDINMFDIQTFLHRVEQLRDNGEAETFSPETITVSQSGLL